ncbi:hypothetical protein EUX98_g7108 [Antrodiella citrinella]|uniref:Spc7 kinetochore protein domain-containing protein n=1 Tax=Antrodiella citrinella TaxID=2447956 RepID=A0A4S4MMM6_9APHY|nr:hypothetical protein EUX98_g7108 [Antrodiella citrinella]
MDLTEVVNNTRSRRVSFAAHAHVRLFTKDTKKVNFDEDATSSSPEVPPEQHINDENEHPEDASTSRRRSSRRRSSTTFSNYGEQSMDLDEDDDTSPIPAHMRDDQPLYDDGLSDDEDFDDDGDDMELTEAINQKILRKKSLSLGGGEGSIPHRRRSSTAHLATSSLLQSENQPPPVSNFSEQDAVEEPGLDQDQDLTGSSAHSQSFMSEGPSSDHHEPVEYTVPMGQALHGPATEDPVWQQLRAVTHAGSSEPTSDDPPRDEDDTSEPMDLTDALGRLMEARKSLGMPPPNGPLVNLHSSLDDGLDDSFTSNEDSFGDSDILENQTMNITKTLNRSSVGSQDMDVTDVLHRDIRVHSPSTSEPARESVPPRPPSLVEAQPLPQGSLSIDPPRVFSAPPPRLAQPPPPKPSILTMNDRPFTFSLPPKPIAEAPRSPSKIPVFRGTAAFAPPTMPKSPKKRSAPEDLHPSVDADQPSPAKKQAVARLSPSNAGPAPAETSSATAAISKRPGPVRRPSGYFAQRKSLGAGMNAPAQSTASSSHTRSPAKSNAGRASLGPPAAAGSQLYPDLAPLQKGPLPPLPRLARSNELEHHRGGNLSQSTQAATSSTSSLPTALVPELEGQQDVAIFSEEDNAGRLYPILERSVSPVERRGSMTEAIRSTPDLNLPPRISATPMESEEDSEVPPDEEYNVANPSSTQQWRDEVEGDDNLEDEGPPISIEQFFEMTGIRFMEEITAPRRASIHPSQLQSRSRRRPLPLPDSDLTTHSVDNALSESDSSEVIPLADFITAMAIDIPQLELYSTIANQLSGWIEDSRKICRQADEEARQVTPGVFRDFAEADPSDKEFLIHQLKVIKANNHGTAKSQWYEWKKDWTEQLHVTAEATFAELESDAKVLEDINTQAQAMLPALQAEYDQVMKELEEEQASVAEIENCDKDFLSELKVTIAEQDSELESYRADVSEAKAKLTRLEEKLTEIDSQKQEATAAISQAERVIHIQKESTSAEVFRLKDELEALQDLHLWRVTKLTASVMELLYASRYQVLIPCVQFKPVPARVEVRKTKASQLKERDPFPQLTQLMLDGAHTLVRQLQRDVTPQEIVHVLGDFWTSCTQLRSQFTFLAIKYPVIVEVKPASDGSRVLIARATVLFVPVMSKARISFVLDAPTYSKWPSSIASLQTDVDVAYGGADRDLILSAVAGRLAQATSSDNHGCLLDACIEAAEQYR